MSNDLKRINVVDTACPQDLPAGDFSTWLVRAHRAQIENLSAEVPCGRCNVCC